jgi:predicted phosphodiesterase/predicted transcriptional regulator
MRESNYTRQQICEQLNVSEGTVSKYTKDISFAERSYTKSERDEHQKTVHELIEKGLTFKDIKNQTNLSKEYIAKLSREIPKPIQTELPEAIVKRFQPYIVDRPGLYTILSDVHVPSHDSPALKIAIENAVRKNATGIIINGDFLDSHELSDHDKDPSAPRYRDEIEMGVKVLGWIRNKLPNAKIIYKVGNHDERLDRYIVRRAPAFFDMEFANIETLLKFKQFDIDIIDDHVGQLVIFLGAHFRLPLLEERARFIDDALRIQFGLGGPGTGARQGGVEKEIELHVIRAGQQQRAGEWDQNQ